MLTLNAARVLAARSLTSLRSDVAIASLCLNLLALALPFSILLVYDRVIGGGSVATLASLSALLFLTLVFEAGFRVLRSFVHADAAARFEHDRSTRLFRTLFARTRDDAKPLSASEQLNLFRDVQRVKEFRFGPAAAAAVDVPFAFVALLLIVAISGPLVAAPLVILAGVLAAIALITVRLAREVQSQRSADRQRFDFLFEIIAGFHTVKAMALEHSMAIRHQRLQRASSSAVERIVLLNGAAEAATAFAANAATAVIVAFGAVLAVRGELTMGALAASTMLAGRMLQPISRAASSWTRYQTVRDASERLERHLTASEAAALPPGEDTRLQGHIRLEDVRFAYPGESADVIAHADMMAMAGAMVGLTGPTGSGKSTLLRIAAGEIAPTSGRVTLDGAEVHAPLPEALARRIAYISAHGGLFTGSILQNVAMFRSGGFEERAIKAINFVGLDAYIASLPRGLDTPIGGGEIASAPPSVKQLLLIARALVDENDVVIFDDASDALDIPSDQRVITVLKTMRRRRTVIIATQRPSYLKMCDAVYGLNNGRLDVVRGFATPATEDDANLRPTTSETADPSRAAAR